MPMFLEGIRVNNSGKLYRDARFKSRHLTLEQEAEIVQAWRAEKNNSARALADKLDYTETQINKAINSYLAAKQPKVF